ncbi:hypothetical protein ETAA8_27400 [Anatilimnocola aggregata]|uniref:Uncharacterized protein n=1 Tax=Anatilimnocola aggregata TaxID=2528021 RepID=A0A517YBR2_9BACT|nr:hypothetical protein ETAA8_27400 [Anatilimnocola aggregata]
MNCAQLVTTEIILFVDKPPHCTVPVTEFNYATCDVPTNHERNRLPYLPFAFLAPVRFPRSRCGFPKVVSARITTFSSARTAPAAPARFFFDQVAKTDNNIITIY